MSCPCGSAQAYADCCERYHAGLAAPSSAEALMRSRYVAYAQGLDDYLYATWHPRMRSEQSSDSHVSWVKLEILRTEAGGEQDSEGVVEFKAYWKAAGRVGCLHETSRFLREQGRWYYLDGDIHPRRQ